MHLIVLIELYDMIEKGIYKPVGVPVGFVNVEAAKELIMETGVPYIGNVGRKGGNIAAAICNALIYSLVDRGSCMRKFSDYEIRIYHRQAVRRRHQRRRHICF